MKENKKFPWKKAFVSSTIILMVFLLVLALLYTIVNNTANKKNIWIIFPIWGGALFLGLLSYWIYQIKKHYEKK